MITINQQFKENQMEKFMAKMSALEQTDKRIPIAYQLIASILVVFNNFTLKQLSHIPTNQVLICKSFITLMMIFPFQENSEGSCYSINRRIFKKLILGGILGSSSTLVWIISLKLINLSEAMVLANTIPIWTMLMAAFILKSEKLALKHMLNFILSLAGILLIIRPNIIFQYISEEQLSTEDDYMIHLFGVVFSVLTAILTSGIQVTLSSLNLQLDQMTILTFFSIISIVVPSLFQMCIETQPLVQLSMSDCFLFLLCGLTGSAYQYLTIKSFTIGNLVQMSIVEQSQILFGFIFDLSVYHTDIHILSFIGSIILTFSLIYGILMKQN